MRVRFLAAALVLASLGSLLAVGPASAAPATTRLSAFNDINSDSVTRGIVSSSIAEGATGFVGSLDVEPTQSVATALSILSPLTSRGSFAVLGNHDSTISVGSLLPSGATWSRSVGGARIVGANTNARLDVGSSQYDFVRSALCNAPESTRVLVLHAPWWLVSGAAHPGSQFPGSPAAMDQLVKDCRVGLVLTGHEHNYQRLVRNGANYVVAGIGGAPLYPLAGIPSGTAVTCRCWGHVILDINAGGYSARLVGTNGATLDSFGFTAPTGGGAIAFSGSTGNEWWAQVLVSGPGAASVAKVEAMDTGGPWVALTRFAWGYAGSFHIEPGHTVQYRATLNTGAVVSSCVFSHPAGVCTTGDTGSSTFTASFTHPRGNDWWVETDVTASGGTLAGVDARVDGGSFVPLTHTSWGSWAKSIHAPSGSSVQFRARASDGRTASSPVIAWPP